MPSDCFCYPRFDIDEVQAALVIFPHTPTPTRSNRTRNGLAFTLTRTKFRDTSSDFTRNTSFNLLSVSTQRLSEHDGTKTWANVGSAVPTRFMNDD